MSDLFGALVKGLSGDEFEEIPVDVFTFVTGEKYLGLKGLSEHQYSLVKAMTQIYRKETLVALFGGDEKKAMERYKQTCKEVIMQLGKGSGKDFTSTVAVSYAVYLLLCLKDPATYYDKPKGDSIDIINIAINSDQANRVFFKNFVERIKNCEWFEGKYNVKAGSIEFDKNVTVYSGHSEREAFEGYNTLMVILDEISGFALESATGNEQAKTAPAIYKMYRASITSRFPDFGKLVLLSFPRFENDFIQQRYNEVIAEKEVIQRKEIVPIDPDLPIDAPGNSITIEWEEDNIITYKRPKVFALRRPSWEVNPARKISDYADDFVSDMGDALGRFACMPSNLKDGYFKNMDAVRECFSSSNGVDHEGVFGEWFQPEPETMYFMHVDLAQKRDRCVVAMAHIAGWKEFSIGAAEYTEYLPIVKIDALRWWQPTKDKSVDFNDVVAYITAVRRRGFNLKMVTFDRWGSHDTRNNLERLGIKTDQLSVAKKHFDDLLVTTYDKRVVGPNEPELLKEIENLRENKGKIESPSTGYDDLSYGVAGAVYNAVQLTPKDINREVDPMTLSDLKKIVREEEGREKEIERLLNERPGDVIVPPKPSASDAPADIQDLLRLL